MSNRISSLIGVVIISILSNCSNFYNDKDLGGNYVFWEDADQSSIIYEVKPNKNGHIIIDANVEDYSFNDRFIIAKTNWLLQGGATVYWIIDKSVKINIDTSRPIDLYNKEFLKGRIGPLSRDSFDLFLLQNKIDLRLRE